MEGQEMGGAEGGGLWALVPNPFLVFENINAIKTDGNLTSIFAERNLTYTKDEK